MKSLEQSNTKRLKVRWWPPGARGGEWGFILNGGGVSAWEDEEVWKQMVVIVVRNVRVHKATELHFKNG